MEIKRTDFKAVNGPGVEYYIQDGHNRIDFVIDKNGIFIDGAIGPITDLTKIEQALVWAKYQLQSFKEKGVSESQDVVESRL
jgi:hypothetical protein